MKIFMSLIVMSLVVGCSSVKSTTTYETVQPEKVGVSTIKYYPAKGVPYYSNSSVIYQK